MFLGAGTDSMFRVRSKRDHETGGGTQISISGPPGIDFSHSQYEQARINTPISSIPEPADFEFMVIYIVLVIGTAVLVVSIFVSNVIEVGKKRYFLKKTAWSQEEGIRELFSGFREGYGNLVLVMFRKGLSIFLWSLLLFIPGIIRSYEYYMVPYLLAGNPRLSWERARD